MVFLRSNNQKKKKNSWDEINQCHVGRSHPRRSCNLKWDLLFSAGRRILTKDVLWIFHELVWLDFNRRWMSQAGFRGRHVDWLDSWSSFRWEWHSTSESFRVLGVREGGAKWYVKSKSLGLFFTTQTTKTTFSFFLSFFLLVDLRSEWHPVFGHLPTGKRLKIAEKIKKVRRSAEARR